MYEKTISHYNIISRIGQGGMGVVYKALDTRLGRTVALKFLPEVYVNNKEAKNRFIQEAKAASSLQHQNICGIHDIDETPDGQIFICMDFYDGQTLKEKIDKSKKGIPFGPDEAAGIAKQIASGLKAAHKNGIIHRDIKPSNIFITKDNSVKILDFGLAKLSGNSDMTRTGETMGTAAYMPPEQARGEAAVFGSDIWSFGVVLFEMLTGEMPFKGEYDQAVVYSILNNKPSNKLREIKAVPDYLKEICYKCLAKKPDDRPESFDEIENILENKNQYRFNRKLINSKKTPVFRMLAALFFAAVAISVFIMITRNNPLTVSPQGKLRIGIIQFQNNNENKAAGEWPSLIQSLLSGQLTGREEFAVMDVFNFNGMIQNTFGTVQPQRTKELYKTVNESSINFLIDGAIYANGSGYVINCNVVNPSTGNSHYSFSAGFENPESLLKAVSNLAHKIYDFFRVQVLKSAADENLKPWISQGAQNLEAQEAFLQAGNLIYRFKPGADLLLRKAINLDSNFISARVWLVSMSVYEGDTVETKKQLTELDKLKPTATSFELAMINWAHALVADDIIGQTKSISTALSYSPGNNILLINLAELYYMLGDIEGAIDALKIIEQSGWHYPPQYPLLVKCYIKNRNFTEAREVLSKALLIEPVVQELHLLDASLYLVRGDSAGYEQKVKIYFNSYKEKNTHIILGTLEEVGGIYQTLDYTQIARKIYTEAFKTSADENQLRAIQMKINSLI